MSGFTLYAARHGQTEANAARRFPGHSATPLTEIGKGHGRTMGQILLCELGSRPALAFVSSPLPRAMATMRLIREELGLPPDDFTTDARLADIHHGDWTGFTWDEVIARDPGTHARHVADRWNVKMTGGECYADVAARVRSFLDEVRGDMVTVSHGATTQMLRGLLTGMAPRDIIALEEPQGVVFRVRDNTITRLDPA
jgi:broad specificity phosphatase PhoE